MEVLSVKSEINQMTRLYMTKYNFRSNGTISVESQ